MNISPHWLRMILDNAFTLEDMRPTAGETVLNVERNLRYIPQYGEPPVHGRLAFIQVRVMSRSATRTSLDARTFSRNCDR